MSEIAVVEDKVPKARPAKKMERLNVTMSPKLREKLEELQELTYASSASEVICDALILYAGLIDEHQKGRELFVKDEDGEHQYRVFIKG